SHKDQSELITVKHHCKIFCAGKLCQHLGMTGPFKSRHLQGLLRYRSSNNRVDTLIQGKLHSLFYISRACPSSDSCRYAFFKPSVCNLADIDQLNMFGIEGKMKPFHSIFNNDPV